MHIAAAAYEPGLTRALVTAGAIVRAANRRGAEPLHYAVDGIPGSARWNPVAQRETVLCLIELGADPKAVDKNGTTPLHRAVRNRCAAAVKVLLDVGVDPHSTNGSGSTAIQLARWTTGRGGSGSTHEGTTTGDHPTPASFCRRMTSPYATFYTRERRDGGRGATRTSPSFWMIRSAEASLHVSSRGQSN